MDRRYQVFVSSTYADLESERHEVMQALLELDCIPSGMELFPAANEDQWTLIKKVIDDCDYYLVIVAGRYGTSGPDGKSYTEMEYRYAIEKNKPVIAFVHKTPETLPSKRCEQTAEGRAALDAFRTLVQSKMCKYWESAQDLGGKVSRSLVILTRDHPATGWVRGDFVGEIEAGEILRLRQRIEQLERELGEVRVRAPEGTSELAQGQDTFALRYSFSVTDPSAKGTTLFNVKKPTWYRDTTPVTWEELFAAVSPLMLDAVSDQSFEKELNLFVRDRVITRLQKVKKLKGSKTSGFTVDREDFQTIKIQFRALGLIAKSTKTRSVKDTQTYWTLTPYGDTVMTRLRAISK